MNARLAEAIDATTTTLRLSYSTTEIAGMQAAVDSADAALAAARGREHGAVIDARLDRLAEAQAMLDAAMDYMTPAEDLYAGQILRLDDDLVVIRRLDGEHIRVERGALGARSVSHDAGAELIPAPPIKEVALEFVMDGAGLPLETGEKGQILIPFVGQIRSASLLADQAGSVVVDVLRSAFADLPDAGVSIVGSSKPTLDAEAAYHDEILDGWTVGLQPDDVLHVVVESAAAVERLTLVLTIGT